MIKRAFRELLQGLGGIIQRLEQENAELTAGLRAETGQVEWASDRDVLNSHFKKRALGSERLTLWKFK